MKISDLDLLEAQMIEQARRSFWAYRQYMNPKMKKGWWQREVAHELQAFYQELCDGSRPMLVIQAPPQHGKSFQIIDFISWLAGHNPDLRTIYTSFSERLGVRANLRLQRIYDSPQYQKVFPGTRITGKKEAPNASGKKLRNHEILEYLGHEGYFRNTTVRGSITGEGLDLGIIDDPIKGREEAGSLTIRNKTWDWMMDDFFTRFSDEAGMLSILTRWHVDDPIGRLIAAEPRVKVLSYPAIAVKDEKYRKEGEALFPEHKSVEFLLQRKSLMFTGNWEALYQQNPIVMGGNIIRGEKFGRYGIPPKITHRVIYGDTAMKTAERNDFSVFELWGKGEDGKIYLLDLLRGKWEAPQLRQAAKDFWAKHAGSTAQGHLRAMKIEDKASGTGLIQDLKNAERIPVIPIPREKDKFTRVMNVLPYIDAGYVMLPEDAPYVADFIAECEAFTPDDTHAHDDQIDPMCDAIMDMLHAKPKGFFSL